MRVHGSIKNEADFLASIKVGRIARGSGFGIKGWIFITTNGIKGFFLDTYYIEGLVAVFFFCSSLTGKPY
jgi:hypothetical protein